LEKYPNDEPDLILWSSFLNIILSFFSRISKDPEVALSLSHSIFKRFCLPIQNLRTLRGEIALLFALIVTKIFNLKKK